MTTSFYRIFKSLDLGPEEHLNTCTPIVALFRRILIGLKGVLRQRKLGYGATFQYIFDCPNKTKFEAMRFLYNQFPEKSLIVVTHSEGERGHAFQKYLEAQGIKYKVIKEPSYEPQILLLLIQNVFKPQKAIFDFDAYRILLKFYRIFLTFQPSVFISSNDDQSHSKMINLLCRKIGVKTVNVMHGRGYLIDHTYDVSIVSSQSQISFLRDNTNSNSKFHVFNRFAHEPLRIKAYESRSSYCILFYDQPSFELYPEKIRSQVLSDLKKLESQFKNISIFVKPHPSSPKNLNFYGLRTESIEKEKISLGLTVCSTVGFECLYEENIPVLYMNYSDVLENFSHVKMFKPISVKNFADLSKTTIDLLNDPNSWQAYINQVKSLCAAEFHKSLKVEDLRSFLLDSLEN